MVNILLAEGCDDIFDDGKVITILDQACGTGGMLSTGYNFIKRYNPSADVRLFGQEINPESYAMCLAEMLIKGQNAENICYQDTMKADRFKGTKMRFVLENPPFGTAWGGKDAAEGVEDAVNAEYQKGFDGRWGAGLPGSGDMQMLFLQSAIDKMDDNFGRAAIIENGRIKAAGCVLPLSNNLDLGKDMGTRHRACLGIAENSDAIAIVVSEETGIISMAKNGVLMRHFDRQTLYTRLVDEMIPKETASEKSAAEGWKARGKRLLNWVNNKEEDEQQ